MTGEPRIEVRSSSAVVLGLLAMGGPQTTYEMVTYVELSIGYFWPFPMSQMYAESKRLEQAGLIAGTQEEVGRRRRSYEITEDGRSAFAEWLRAPADRPTEIRDVGLLKLFFVDADPGVSAEELAVEQLEAHMARLAEYRALATLFDGSRPLTERTIELGIAFEQVAVEFWRGVERSG